MKDTIKKLTKPLKLDYVSSDITDENFPNTGEQGTDFKVFHFNEYLETDEVLKKLDADGYRPATIHEMLTWAKDNLKPEKYEPVVALGSVWGARGGRCVAYLDFNGSERGLSLRWIEDRWLDYCRFLAVRKSSELGKSEPSDSALGNFDPLALEIVYNGKKYKLTAL